MFLTSRNVWIECQILGGPTINVDARKEKTKKTPRIFLSGDLDLKLTPAI